MIECPTCKVKVSNTEKKCPFCETKLPKVLKDNIEKLPEIITEPNKITYSESLEQKRKIKINKIPLKVKPVKTPKKKNKKKIKKKVNKNKKKNSKKTFEIKFFSTLKIIFGILLLLLNILLIVNIIIESESSKPQKTTKNDVKKNIPTSIIGSWRTSNNGLFVLDDELNFYWYEYYKDKKHNYYQGTYTYKKGTEAIEEMGYNEEEFYNSFNSDIKIENVYSIIITPTYFTAANKDMTESQIKKNETWWYILMIKDDKTAISYNKTLDLRYNLVLQTD